MKLQKNPFRYGSLVQGEYYCERGLEHAIMQHLSSGNNVYVQGRRRTGKSSLVQESIRRSELKVVPCHLGKLAGADDFVTALSRALSTNRKWFVRIVETVGAMRPVMTMPNGAEGSWGLTLTSSGNAAMDLVALLDALEKNAPKGGMVVYLDEFQQILKLEDAERILWDMRNAIQQHERCRYVFAGSVKTLMDSIFLDSRKPFFNSAIPFEVSAIDRERYWEFVASKFHETGREIEREAFDLVYEFTDGVVGDLQEVFSEAWNQSVSFVKRSSIEEALRVCVERKKGLFMALVSRYSERQMRVLRAVAAMGASKPTSMAFLKASQSRSPSYVKTTLERFVSDGVLLDDFRFENPFFGQWFAQ